MRSQLIKGTFVGAVLCVAAVMAGAAGGEETVQLYLLSTNHWR